MPYTTFYKLTSSQLGEIGTEVRTYNFWFPVSAWGGGEQGDVMLLQALLRMAYYEFPGVDGAPEPPAGSTGDIKVDGIMGMQTGKHLYAFQRWLFENGFTKTVDGVMDPFKKQGVMTSITQVRYQLEQLNALCYLLAVRQGDAGVHQNMTDLAYHGEEVYPPSLRNALAVPMVML